MVSIKVLLIICLIFIGTIFSSSIKQFNYSANFEFSDQISTFYEDVMTELYYYVETDENYSDNETHIFKNTLFTLSHNFNFSHRQHKLNTAYFSPLFKVSFSYKQIRYLFKSGSGYFTSAQHYKSSNMRNGRIFLGFTPEFSFKLNSIGKQKRVPIIAIRPVISAGETFFWGTLDQTALTVIRSGIDMNFEFLKSRDTKYRGIAFSFFSYYDITILGDRNYGATYGNVLQRSVEYPKSALIVGVSIGTSLRRFGGDDEQ